MQTINLSDLIQKHNLDPREVAAELFPAHKYPLLALGRILDGKAVLDANQISRLSLFTDLPIASLFSGVWKMKALGVGEILFTSGEYTAKLNTEFWTTKIYHNGSIFHDVILHRDTLPLREYFEELNTVISEINNK